MLLCKDLWARLELSYKSAVLWLSKTCMLQEFGVVDKNLLGNNRSWLGFADDKYADASDSVKSGWNTIKDKAQDL